MMEGKEAVKEAKKFVDKFKPDLTITDVPIKALNQFKKLADEEFKPKGGSAHYGFTLKFLLDFYFGIVIDGASVAKAMATEALEQIAEIKQQSAKGTEKRTIRTLDGKEKVIK